jgi:FAD/FMN-containing dehydrogenase
MTGEARSLTERREEDRMDATSLLSNLRGSVTGRVIGPDDPGYDEGRTLFYGGFDRRPAAIVRVTDNDDVSRVVSMAAEAGFELAVRSGGHSVAGHSVVDGGVVMDLSAMRGMEVDLDQRTAWAEPGLTAVKFSTVAGAHDLAISFGDTGSVGIGGITLGGGVGYLVRKHGLAIDDLLAADIVTADGNLLRTDSETHPDLFWAIRGGGGNFGVATRFQFQLHQVPSVVGGMLLLPATPDVVAGFMAEAEAAPEELSAIANVMPAMPMPFLPAEQHGRLVVMAFMCYAGATEAGERALAPFRTLAEPIADLLRPMSYQEIYPPEPDDYHPTAVGHTMFMDRVGLDETKTIVEYLEASDATLRVTQLRVLGGAMARVPAEATAFAHRGSRIMVNVGAFYEGPEDLIVRRAWVEDLAGALRQSDGGAYVGFLGDEGEERIRAAYPGSTWERLREVKARYDPANLFRLNQNIPPAGSG